MEHVVLNISGTNFEFSRNILDGKAVGRLTKMCDLARRADEPLVFFVDRPPESFGAILSYYQTGELHMPTTLCPGNFQRELEFWEIDRNKLSDCCRYRLQAYYEEMNMRGKFLKAVFAVNTGMASPCPGRLGRCMKRVWNIVDYNEKTVVSKVYLMAVFLMVLLSICTLAYSTESSFQRPLSKCEYLEYMEHSKHSLHESVVAIFGDIDCVKKLHWFHVRSPDEYEDDDYIDESYFDDWEYDQDDLQNVSKKSNNTENDTRQTVAEKSEKSGPHQRKKPMVVPYLTVRVFVLDVLETITIIFFTIDFIIRIISCPSRVRYFFSVINAIDVIALVGCYIHLITINVERHHRYDISWVHFINYVQAFRAMRFLRVFSSVRAGKVLVYSLKSNARDFVLVVLLVLFGITAFSTLLFFIEDRTNIKSIPEAWYWSIITMTTVGYGDVVPKSGFGKLLASICSICGVLFLAVSLPLFVNNFLTLYQYSNIDKTLTSSTEQTTGNCDSPEKPTNGTSHVIQTTTVSKVSAETT